MVFHPAILALLVGSLLTGFMLFYAGYYGIVILKRWDLRSGSEIQLGLERRTYLISTLMAYSFGFQLLSLFLFVYTADHLSSLFVGAMCAAGTLHVNPHGYPAFLLKVVNFILGGLWLILNHADNRGCDYPLIRKKYGLLLFITPFVLAEMVLQGRYFLGLKPDIITSCCGTLFTSEVQGVASKIFVFPRYPTEIAFYASMTFTFILGLFYFFRGKAGYLFSLSCLITFLLSVVALISFLCLYFYELPTHHCPFCILQKEYSYAGYPIFLALLGGAVLGMGVGLLMPFREIKSLQEVLPPLQRNLALAALIAYAVFTVIVVYQRIFSNLRM